MKPMLACSTIPNLEDIKYPVIASPKLDGIRCLIIDGKAVSRNLKPIPNRYVRDTLAKLNLPDFDGELMLEDGADFNSVQSAFMSKEGQPDFVYNIFDRTDLNVSFKTRYHMLGSYMLGVDSDFLKLVPHILSPHKDDLAAYWKNAVEAGYEGLIVRDPDGPYKFGRSTLKQGWMLKLKTFLDTEAVIIGREELMHNHNEAEVGELGQTKRSKHLANLEGGSTLGALWVQWQGVEFKIGTGFDAAQRQELWDMGDDIIGQLAKFKYQELSAYGVPRFPVFLSLRSKDDV